ncbi:protein MRVI1 isoform X2 [Cynoglossus semilaevis]|uniref:protein MRVI1 isoform X2 n=1 Tax=Cynoglossus semilaevis TaxID=244447 RepID=UPI000D628CDD|nr:protein MRVI1 isoform X2 [Cynoglossus semilaevis]
MNHQHIINITHSNMLGPKCLICLYFICHTQDSVPGERQDRPFPYCQQQQASIKQQLVNVLQELELQKYVWEERAEKVEERWRASEKEHIQSQTGSQDAKKAAVLNWWKALTVAQVKKKVEETKSLQELSEAQEKLQRAERTISDMREQINHLQVSLRSALDCGTEQKNSSKICYIDKGTNTKREDVHKSVGTEVRGQKDAAVITEITGGIASQQEQTQLQLSADGLLSTLKRMEAMVTKALGTAELIRESEQRVIQVKTRMETITCQVQEALGRTSNTEEQLNVLEARITEEFTCQYPRSTPLADPRPEVKCFTEASDVDSVNGEKLESPPPSTVLPEVIESPQLPVNVSALAPPDCRGASSRSKLQEEETHILQDTPSQPTDDNPVCVGKPFIFPHTRSRPPLLPSMPTLPEEEEDSPEEMDSSSSSPTTSAPCENRAMMMAAPTIVYPQQATVVQPDEHPLEKARPHSPRTRLARSSSSGPITTVDSTGNVIDLVKDPIPEVQLSEEDRLKNLDLLEQAKRVSDRFLTRRGRRSSSSLTESPTGLSPPTTPSSSPNSSRSSSVTVAPQSGSSDATAASFKFVGQHLEVPSLKQQPAMTTDQEKENCDPAAPRSPPAGNIAEEGAGTSPFSNQAPATGVAKPVPRPPTQQAPCTAEIKTIGAFPPLMRAVSWDAVGGTNSRSGAPSFPPTAEDTFSDKPRDVFKSSGYKDVPAQPAAVQKLSKLREEHKLMRNQSMAGSKLADLSEASEQEKGPMLSPTSVSAEAKERSDAMPNISDVMLRKLKLHRGLPGCAPPLTEKEVENAFVQLSLAFRNDNYTLETRMKQAERERNLTEEDTEKELEEFKRAMKMTAPQWQNLEQREAYQRLVETVTVLKRLATRLSSRAEIVGAVRQEKRMNKATEVMMQYVENLKRTYEKDHAELTEFKKLANQNSNRCYGGSGETGEDGVPRSSRSMSVTLGKALPRRRVSVAVVPKFNLLNIPGQTPATAGSGPSTPSGPNMGPATGAAAALPVLGEVSDVKARAPTDGTQPAAER